MIITSHRNFPFIEEDGEKINKYEANFNNNDLEVGEERKRYFFTMIKKQARDYMCIKDREEDVESFASHKTLSANDFEKE